MFGTNMTKPEVSNSNVHGDVHGKRNENFYNTGGVEDANFIRRINRNPEGVALLRTGEPLK